jgi:hypothetical protein
MKSLGLISILSARTREMMVMACRREFTTFILLLSHLTHMRCLIPVLLMALAVTCCGCTHTEEQPVVVPSTTPVPTATTAMITAPITTTVTPVQMQINVTAWKSESEIDVQYNGGANGSNLTNLQIHIYNHNGDSVSRTITGPVIGTIYRFLYIGTLNADRVNVVGTFQDGSQQTVLLTNV